MSRGGGSELSAVARVLFESAAKSGIISGDSRKKFAKQLQRLATQSKQSGGSLDGVSMRMSEFVKRETEVRQQPRVPLPSTKGVPSLNIPSLDDGHASSKALRTVAPRSIDERPKPTGGLNLSIPGLRRKDAPHRSQSGPTMGTTVAAVAPPSPAAAASPSTLALHEPQLVPGLEKRDPPTPESTSTADGARKKSQRAFVSVEADDNVLASFKPAAAPASSGDSDTFGATTSVHKVVVVQKKLPTSSTTAADRSVPPPKVNRQRLVAPEGADAADTTRSFTLSTDELSSTTHSDISAPSSSLFASTTSIDDWESQREQEISQLQASQREHEEKIAAAAEAERQRALGEEWTLQRQVLSTSSPSTDPFLKANELLFFAPSWEEAKNGVEQALRVAGDGAGRGSAYVLPDYTLTTAVKKMRSYNVPRAEQDAYVEWLSSQLEKLSNGAMHVETLKKIHAPRRGGKSDDVGDGGARSKPARIGGGALPPPSILRTIRDAVADGKTWEQVLSLYTDARNVDSTMARSRSRQKTMLERTTALVMYTLRHTMTRDVRVSVALQLVEGARKKSYNIDRRTASILSRLLGGRQALALVGNLDAPEADESTLAAHIRHSREEEIASVLERAVQLGYNLRDPIVVEALAYRTSLEKDQMRIFAMIAEQRSDGVAMNRTHVRMAVLAARVLGSREAIDATLAILADPGISISVAPARLVTGALFPHMYELGMLEEIYQLYQRYKDSTDFPLDLPNETLFVNSALKSKGLPPLTENDASSLPPRQRRSSLRATTDATLPDSAHGDAQGGRGESSSSSTISASATLESIVPTDSMLEFAKERNWEAALAALQRLPQRVSSSQEATAVLYFNCALSAAIDEPALVDKILLQLETRGDLRPNSTTYNTAMSAFARNADLWNRAIEIYAGMQPQQRDASTFSVMLSLLGKHSKWQEAIGVWDDVKSSPSVGKPSVTLYSLGIQAVHKQSWANTLALYQDLIKAHGLPNVKEVVTLRVLKSLEDNKKFTEAQKLEHQLEKLRAKGKKKNKT